MRRQNNDLNIINKTSNKNIKKRNDVKSKAKNPHHISRKYYNLKTMNYSKKLSKHLNPLKMS